MVVANGDASSTGVRPSMHGICPPPSGLSGGTCRPFGSSLGPGIASGNAGTQLIAFIPGIQVSNLPFVSSGLLLKRVAHRLVSLRPPFRTFWLPLSLFGRCVFASALAVQCGAGASPAGMGSRSSGVFFPMPLSALPIWMGVPFSLRTIHLVLPRGGLSCLLFALRLRGALLPVFVLFEPPSFSARSRWVTPKVFLASCAFACDDSQ
ncbi:unnamed protein product [Symbiodinium sp. CCMP2592]|nr:unnamed protein product [Symbiodinium sp. CCMP2592]